jgi:ABC-type bacteriocin/lantibiotic exporter with double-glycine peptidase domain
LTILLARASAHPGEFLLLKSRMKAVRAFLLLSITVSLLSGRLTYADQVALPWIKQKTATECGRAVLASVAARHGGDVETFYSRLPAPPDRRRGYSILQLQKFGARIGVNLSLIEPEGITIAGECSERLSLASYFSKLENLVAAGRPVIVPIGDASSRGHYLVLVGATDGNFIALDPSTPERKKINARELQLMMCGFGYAALAVLN